MTIVTTRTPTLDFIRLHQWETGLSFRIFWNGQIATGGDGKPSASGTPVDYTTAIAGPLPAWPAGQASPFGGGALMGAALRNNANGGLGLGIFGGGAFIGEFGRTSGKSKWKFPFNLRDGVYTLGIRLRDRLDNEQTTPAFEITFEVAALPRPATRARLTGYDPGPGELNIAWKESPDLAA